MAHHLGWWAGTRFAILFHATFTLAPRKNASVAERKVTELVGLRWSLGPA